MTTTGKILTAVLIPTIIVVGYIVFKKAGALALSSSISGTGIPGSEAVSPEEQKALFEAVRQAGRGGAIKKGSGETQTQAQKDAAQLQKNLMENKPVVKTMTAAQKASLSNLVLQSPIKLGTNQLIGQIL